MTVQLNVFGGEIVERAKLSRDLLEDLFSETIYALTAEQLVAMLYSPFEAVIDFAALCRGDNTGQKISMLFNPHRYDVAAGFRFPSIICSLKQKSFLKGVARAAAWKEGTTRDLLYNVLRTGVNGVQHCDEFPPHIARDIYCDFNGRRILDPCAGWGGRMIGAASVGALYHGFEPSTKTYMGLLKLGTWLKRFNTGFDFKIENIGFEDATISDDYDVALTSPPYYDTEKYADEATQAAIRYKTFESFSEGFYKPLVYRAATASKQGLIFNIGSRKYPLREKLLEVKGVKVRELMKFTLSRHGLGKNPDDGEKFFHVERC